MNVITKKKPNTKATTAAGDAGHGISVLNAEQRLPKPSWLTSLWLSYPRATLWTTLWFQQPLYIIRNLWFLLKSTWLLLTAVATPIVIMYWMYYWVYYCCSPSTVAAASVANENEHDRSLLSMFTCCIVLTIVHVVTSRFVEFKRFSHIPGPKPSFLYGNYNDLTQDGWGNRHYVSGFG